MVITIQDAGFLERDSNMRVTYHGVVVSLVNEFLEPVLLLTDVTERNCDIPDIV
jgi:hypothetical protein